MTYWLLIIGLGLPHFCFSAINKEVRLKEAKLDIQNIASRQRGAKFFINYCSGCHSLKYMHYNQLAQGLELFVAENKVDKSLLFNNLVFTRSEIADPIQVAMPLHDARQWFGVIPPDLSLIARVRGTDWLYSFLKGFYEDKSRPFGSNNIVFPDVAMPNVLAPLQGRQIAIYQDGRLSHLQLVERGTMSQSRFDSTVLDIVNFLSYVAEPIKEERQRLGYWVIAFLLLLLPFVYALKTLYWRKVN